VHPNVDAPGGFFVSFCRENSGSEDGGVVVARNEKYNVAT